MNIEYKSILFTLALSLFLGFISIKLFGEYGWFIFLLIPFLIGFLPAFLTGKTKEISLKQANILAFKTLGLSCLGLLIFAIEGLICIAMALPILLPLMLIGSYLGFKNQQEKGIDTTNITIILIIASVGLMGFDYVSEPEKLIAVKTKITVDAQINTVWNNVVTFDKIKEPTDWIFKTGIAYPTDATIKGKGIGAIRHCNFTTGSFIEPITVWKEPYLLAFDVKEQPIPMNELNPFWDVHPPHLDGYFKSHKGQFKLSVINENQTEIEGTTWYQIDITPETYWKLWSDFIIHRIHKRVLNHIKEESEK